MKQLIHPLLALTLAASAACSQKESGNSTPERPASAPSNKIYLNGRSAGEVQRQDATPEEIQAQQEKRRVVSFQDLNVPHEYNAEVYKIHAADGTVQYRVKPRVFVYGSMIQKLAVQPDGQVIIPFHIALIDGLSEQTLRQDMSGTTLPIDPNLRVKDTPALLEHLRRQEHAPTLSLSGIPGCPSSIKVRALGEEFDVTPTAMRDADYCELNRPFVVSLKVSPEKARFILKQSLRNHEVDIAVDYATLVPVPVSSLNIRLEKEKIYEALKADLETGYPPYLEVNVRASIERILKSAQVDISVQGDYNQQMSQMVDKIVQAFFEPAAAHPGLGAKAECHAVTCLNLRYAKQENEDFMRFTMALYENMRLPRTFSLVSKLKPIDDRREKVGFNPLKDKPQSGTQPMHFSNKNSNPQENLLNVYRVSLTPQRGSTILYSPTFYAWENRRRPNEFLFKRHNWDECTGRGGIFGSCSYTPRQESWFRWEYLETDPEYWQKYDDPMLQTGDGVKGLQMYFQFTNGDYVVCNMDDMHGTTVGNVRQIEIENSEACSLFSESRQTISVFGLINNTRRDKIEYTSGVRYWTDYKGEVNEYVTKTYSPEIRLAADITELGSGFYSYEAIK